MLRWIGVATISLLSLVLVPQSIHAITRSEPVELEVPATTVRIDGFAAPNAIVTIAENGATVASVTSNNAGEFSALVTTTAGIHIFQTKFTDKNGQSSQINTLNISVQPQQETQRTIYLSPTLHLASQNVVQRGSIVSIRGYTVPNKVVNVSLDFGAQLYQTTSGSDGYYEYTLQTNDLLEGNHTINTTVINGVNLSDTSRQIIFTLQSSSPDSTPDIVVSPDALPPPVTTLPQDGAIIDGDSVTVYGESLPNAQITIYENGIPFGSISTDDSGKWSFFYKARFSPVTFTFEVCKDGRCSVQSQAITISFTKYLSACDQTVGLEEYRFWGMKTSEEIRLKMQTAFSGTIYIDWGDGNKERFSSDGQTVQEFTKKYEQTGTYNGEISFQYGDCEDTRYFSVYVNESDEDVILWVFIVLLASLVVGSYVAKKDKKQQEKK